MSKMNTEAQKREPPSPAEVQERLNRQHGAITPPSTAVAVAKTTTAPTPIADIQASVSAYLGEIAPSRIMGRHVKWTKNGNFATSDDGNAISEETDFVVHADQTAIMWTKFRDDAPPEIVGGFLYEGYRLPPREEMGDNDKTKWATGLNGQPEDPWKHGIYLVLQQAGTTEFFTFTTSSITGRRAVGNLLRHYDRMRRLTPGELPVVRLKASGFAHRDERVGWVATPAFAVVGRAPRDSAAVPDTSAAGDMDDAIPF